nr:MAG TPA: hypothetical protein [Inoviridae sp.]
MFFNCCYKLILFIINILKLIQNDNRERKLDIIIF